MGADIYLKSIFDKNKAEIEPLFDAAVQRRANATTDTEREAAQQEVAKYYDALYAKGYFRDSYNSTSLFAMYGKSWWQLSYDDDGYLPIEEARRLLADLKIVGINEAVFHERFGGRAQNAIGSMSTAEWREYFEKKRAHLIALLEQSIELNEPLYCSV